MNRTIRTSRFRRQHGFSLIEALIAVVVLATGLLALAALQGALLRSSADAKARSQLAVFAESMMDARRIGGYEAPQLTPGTGSPKLATAAALTAAANAMGASSVTETTTVTQYVADATGAFTAYTTQAAADAALLAAGPAAATFKRIETTLSWADASGSGTPRNLRLSTDISPLALELNSVLVDRVPPDDINLIPIVRRPSPVVEGMIPIALGDGQDTAATNPKPQLIGKQNDTLVSDTRFEVLTFDGTDNLGISDLVRFNKRIETAMIGCTCQTGLTGFPTGGNAPAINSLLRAQAFRPSYWVGDKYSRPEPASYAVASSPASNVSQSELCDVCCRDHRDPVAATGPLFAPELSSHDHYLDPAGSPVASGDYYEACRVIRVEGIWRVTPNPKAQDLSLLATMTHPSTTGSTVAPGDNNRATSPLVAPGAKTSYVNYAYDFVKTFFYDGLTGFDRHAKQTDNGLNEPDYVPIKPGDTRWLHARAVLSDKLETKAAERIQKAKDDCTGTSLIAQAQCVLPYVPMATINVTELAQWAGKETSETGILHTGTLAFAETLKNYAQALLRLHVSALALVDPVNPTDALNPLKDEQTFALVPPTTRTGTWLGVASPSSVLFGDATNPTRGFASIGPATRFNVSFSGLPNATDNRKVNDPALNVGLATPQPCTGNTANNTSNPYNCGTASLNNIDLAVGAFNYLEVPTSGQNVSNPCGGTGNVGKQGVCVAHTLTGVVVDGGPNIVGSVNSRLVSGDLGKPNEVRGLTLPAVQDTPPSNVTLSFSSTTTNAQAVCNATTFVEWTCD